ncbi:hypothetical protein [Lactobacillus hominis]|uniref:hypothetical protein n=1 Tax=Lactobacillus hominis TaxID=1203033 RepID=UPI0023F46A76|nr:hypothetical protein [Lactobacillus hominis]
MNYFEKADNVDPVRIVNEYVGMNASLTRENTILRVQLQQHIDREKELLKILKENVPDVYETLEKGDNNGK